MGTDSTAVAGPVERGVRPRAWTLERTLRAAQTTHSAYLWFSDPQNTAWVPLYDQAAIDALAAERDGLMQTLRDEIDENLRLRELGCARSDENITAMTERVIGERSVMARWMAEALLVLSTLDDESEDGGESLRMLRDRGDRLVKAVLRG